MVQKGVAVDGKSVINKRPGFIKKKLFDLGRHSHSEIHFDRPV